MNWELIFYAIKGGIALLGVVLLIGHMMAAWSHMDLLGQRLRYITLLWVVMAVPGASARQVHELPPIRIENIQTFIGCVLLIVTMVVSIVELRRKDRVN